MTQMPPHRLHTGRLIDVQSSYYVIITIKLINSLKPVKMLPRQ